jgi:hypothetical protein
VEFARLSISLFGATALLAGAVAAATIWLLLTDPVTVADAIQEGQVTPLVRALAGVVYEAFRGLFKYL